MSRGKSVVMCTPERAQSIVDLLLNDPGTARCHIENGTGDNPFALSEVACKGCGETFMQKAVGRQYCARDCYDQHLQRKRAEKVQRPKAERAPVSPLGLGPGKYLEGEAAAYCYSRSGVPVRQVQAEILRLYGFRPGTTTIYRCWNLKEPPCADGPLPDPPALDEAPTRVEPEPEPIPDEKPEETPMPATLHPENTIAGRLKAALAKKGVSQFTAAAEAGVSQSTFSRLIRGLTCQEDTYAEVMRWLNYAEGKAMLEEGIEEARPRKKMGRPRVERPDYTEQRKLVTDALARVQRTGSWLSREIGLSQPGISRWLTSGQGLSPEKVAALVSWAEAVPTQPEPECVAEFNYSEPVAELRRLANQDALARAVGEEGDTLPPFSFQEKITPATFGDWHDDDGFEPDPIDDEEPLTEQQKHVLAIVTEAEAVVDSMEEALHEMRAADISPPESPADAILAAHLERVARAALAELAPELVDQVELGILLAWKAGA